MTPLLVTADVCPADPPTTGVVSPSAPTGTVPASDDGVAPVATAWPMTPGARLLSKPESTPVPAPIAVL